MQPSRIRRRQAWETTAGILVLLLITMLFRQRYELGALWLRHALTAALGLAFLFSLIAMLLPFQRNTRHGALLAIVALVALANVLALGKLIEFLIFPDQNRAAIDGVRLLSTAASIWSTNVVSFALLYWVVDGGGPDCRAGQATLRDFSFPGDIRLPNLADYLFLSFNTATAFSPTDTAPLTTRVRMLMLFESLVSLGALAIAAARAVNILH
ncbi:MAG TPA: DUF1345 domain-containing protein [Candidatus Acidoferrales bacterium]|nr:DUF1345 domain-containing protein [Candidatus Acidoferrales bacterium]